LRILNNWKGLAELLPGLRELKASFEGSADGIAGATILAVSRAILSVFVVGPEAIASAPPRVHARAISAHLVSRGDVVHIAAIAWRVF
jgi:hypothetical protein